MRRLFERGLESLAKSVMSMNPEAVRQAVAAIAADSPGSKDRPYIVKRPAALDEIRSGMRRAFEEGRLAGKKLPEFNSEELDGCIAEQIKLSYLRDLLGENGKVWRAGERCYLDHGIQTQEIFILGTSEPIIPVEAPVQEEQHNISL
jgi:hypothetical protein